ncbi:MAG: hypothetical protein GX678_08535 [Actinomycetales bacterium]|nr:hypothetical protein [Actinomycetales bacterium]
MEPFSSMDFSAVTFAGVLLVLVSVAFGIAVGALRAESFPGATYALARVGCFILGVVASYYAYSRLGNPFEDRWWGVLLKVVPVIVGMMISELVWTWKKAAKAKE